MNKTADMFHTKGTVFDVFLHIKKHEDSEKANEGM